MKFTKMQGCGNDYLYVNGATEKIPAEKKPEIVRLSLTHTLPTRTDILPSPHTVTTTI